MRMIQRFYNWMGDVNRVFFAVLFRLIFLMIGFFAFIIILGPVILTIAAVVVKVFK